MSNEEKEKIITTKLQHQDLYKVYTVTNINHTPHPYMIGTKHIVHASNNHGGILRKETMDEIPCAHTGCNLDYDSHTSDLVCALQLRRNGNQEEANKILNFLVSDLDKKFIDGFIFIETEEGYRVQK